MVGAGPGMGRAIAAALGNRHAPVGLVARRPEALAAVAADLADIGIAAKAYPADVSDELQLRSALAAAMADLGPPRVVVYNASLYVAGTPTMVDVAAFTAGLAVGITGALITLQECAPALVAQQGRGTFLLTGGGLALDPWPEASGLAVQKAGLRNLAYAAAAELAPQGVHVATVTIRGVIEAGGPMDPDRIARVYAELADPKSGPDTSRPVEIHVTAEGPQPA